MLGFFGKSGEANSSRLVAKLKKEHASLLRLYRGIQDAHRNNDHANATVMLNDLIVACEEHLLTERAQLYPSLYAAVGALDPRSKLITDCRQSTENTIQALIDLRAQYEANGADRKFAASFAKYFEDVGNAIAQGIQREEASVYPLFDEVSK